jgi:formamidopyrimidine-DNA glycosylase
VPELPDVEGFRRVLAEHGAGRRIEDVEVLDAGVLRDSDATELARTLTGCGLVDPERHGKWLVARTDGPPAVLFHFGMTGSLHPAGRGDERHRHDRVVLVLEDGEIRYRDMRKLKGLWLAHDEDAVQAVLAEEGPDARDLDREDLDAVLDASRGRLKAVLLDQHRVAGLGNLLVDEILWRARLRPDSPARDLDDRNRAALHREVRKVLREAVPTGHVPGRPSWLTGVRDAPDARCPRCGAALEKDQVGGRTTVWCPRCQPAAR